MLCCISYIGDQSELLITVSQNCSILVAYCVCAVVGGENSVMHKEVVLLVSSLDFSSVPLNNLSESGAESHFHVAEQLEEFWTKQITSSTHLIHCRESGSFFLGLSCPQTGSKLAPSFTATQSQGHFCFKEIRKM